MTDIENVLSSMSTAFNSSPTPGDEASAIDLNNDNTLKWRRHFNNQYAKKNPRKSAVDEEMTSEEKKSAIVGEEAKGQVNSAIMTPKKTHNQQPEEAVEAIPPSTPVPAPSLTATTPTKTSTATETSIPSSAVQSAPACPDNDVINDANKDPPADASPTSIGAKQQKPKKSPKIVQENPSRRSNRTRTVQSISPAPLRRRGRSKKVGDVDENESVVKEDQIQLETKPASPIRTTEESEKDERPGVVEVKEKIVDAGLAEKVVDDIVQKEDGEKESSDNTNVIPNGDAESSNKVVPTSQKDGKEEILSSASKNRKRRSMRFDPKGENAVITVEKSSYAQSKDQPAEKVSKPIESAPTSPKKEILEDSPPSDQVNSLAKINEKTPKKRGRRAKPVSSPATSSSDVPIQIKKVQRSTKESDENTIQDKTPTKEKVPQNYATSASKPTVTSQRPLRRIKPTAKILENEELRYEFESKNIARIVATSAGTVNDSKPALVNSTDQNRSTRTREVKDTTHVEHKNHVTPNRKKNSSMMNYLHVDNIYPRNSKPCPEPQDFLNEIKAAGINLHRSPEDKKLNRKQHRKLIKQKEKLFERLGLRRNNQQDFTESENSSSDNEEFIPHKKINVGKPNVTLRIRNNKENAKGPTTSAQETPKPSQPPGPPPKKVGSATVVPTKEPLPSPPTVNKEIKMICSCQSKPKFYARKSTEVVYCKAIDHVEDHRVGCFNKLQSSDIIPLYRPSTRVPYLLLCEQHLIRFLSHNSCAGCGVFCTQGSFILCKHRHFFHPGCAQKLILNTPYDPSKRSTYPSPKLVLKCPHCGCDTSEKESLVTMKCQNTPVFLPSQKGPIKPAKMGSTTTNGKLSIVRQPPQQCLDLVKYIPESVMNIVVREGAASLNDFTTKDMFYAVNNDDLERVAEIIRSGFDVASEMKEFLDGTCLHLVAHFGTIQMACLLLARNSSPVFLNQRDKELRTAAMCSIIGDKCDILQLFIQVGADITLKGTDGMTCLHFAARSGNLQAAKILLENYSSSVGFKQFNDFLNARDDGGWTALVWASELSHTSIVSLLLNYGADASICDMENNTALHWAVMSSCDDIAKILLQANVRCNVQNINGDTPLHIACRQLDTCAALMLITRGADLMIKNNEGQIPYDCIRDEEDPCARAVGFNMQMRSIGPTGLQAKVICSDISNGRESYPIEVVRRPRISKLTNDIDDETILPDFKYITKSILLQNSVQIDCRVSQMRICSCNDSCNTEKCQCSTISVQNWYTAEGRLNGEFNFDDPPMIFECNDVCGCNKLTCKNRVVQNGMKVPLQVFECQQRAKGWGVRTLRPIPRGSFVAEYTGEILTDMEADRRTDDSYFFDLGSSEHCIDANYYGNVSRFFNHSCSANIVPVRVYYEHQDYRFPKIAFFACKNIAVGEEIAFDYGEKFWAVKQTYFTCKCESSDCRFSTQTDRNQLSNGGSEPAASIVVN